MRGPEIVVREIVRQSIAQVFDHYFAGTNTQEIEQWFNLGGTINMQDDQPAADMLAELGQVQGLIKLSRRSASVPRMCRNASSRRLNFCWKAWSRIAG